MVKVLKKLKEARIILKMADKILANKKETDMFLEGQGNYQE